MRHFWNIPGTLLATSIGKNRSSAPGSLGSMIGIISSGFTIYVERNPKIKDPKPYAH